MARSGKQSGYLDFPLYPERRRPWGWLIIAGIVLGVLIYFGWGRLAQTLSVPVPLSSAPSAVDPESGQVSLVHSEVITPTTPSPPATSVLTDTSADELIDEVDEVEITWAERGGREEVITYTVQSGDTLWNVAIQFDLNVDTLRWSNPELERNPDLLAVGTELVILPVPGLYHSVQAQETLSAIAERFGVAEVDILNYPPNDLTSPDDLQAGHELIVPYGRKELARPTPQPSSEDLFSWPLVGTITQGVSDTHQAIDIRAPYGSPVFAGREGRVIRSGWARSGYGYTVIIDHSEGLLSLYSHMKGEWVQAGDWVEQGQLIGEVGSTGNSSGPHVHFEVRVDGETVNPMDYLPSDGPR
jgi:murein DD-endopeptidase MepM/ murein hydrolase activator NlpD